MICFILQIPSKKIRLDIKILMINQFFAKINYQSKQIECQIRNCIKVRMFERLLKEAQQFTDQYTKKSQTIALAKYLKAEFIIEFGTFQNKPIIKMQLIYKQLRGYLIHISNLQWKHINVIYLNQNIFSPQQIQVFTKSSFQGLEFLNIGGDKEIYNDNLGHWIDMVNNNKTLQVFYLHRSGITTKGMYQFTRLQTICYIKQLDLSCNMIGNGGIKFLVKSHLENLVTLKLNYTSMLCEGLKHLTKGYWPKLTKIKFSDKKRKKYDSYKTNKFLLDGLQNLFLGHNWKQLQQIDIGTVQPFSLLNCALMQNPVQMSICLSNEQLKNSWIDIFFDRGLVYVIDFDGQYDEEIDEENV